MKEHFVQLEERLSAFGSGPSADVIERAIRANEWFTRTDILRAVEAVRTAMLDRARLEAWLADYPFLPVKAPKNVGVIMAGNIPLVGFFDLLCVVASGHRCFYKPSSKDTVLMKYIVDELRAIDPSVPVFEYTSQPLDAVIATGSDNTTRYFRSRYEGVPAILRGNRASAAVLSGYETPLQIAGLAEDIFSYSGLGCRSVSHLLLPRGYDIASLAACLARHGVPNPKYLRNFLQNRAILQMRGEAFTDGGYFLMREDDRFPAAISEITYQYYDSRDEVRSWLTAHCDEVQCIVGDCPQSAGFEMRSAGFGASQFPALADYPDGIDVMAFLETI